MVTALVLSLALTSAADDPKIPAAAGHRVDFHKEVLPILQRRCADCHVGPNPKGKLGIATREEILKGGESGPAAVGCIPVPVGQAAGRRLPRPAARA